MKILSILITLGGCAATARGATEIQSPRNPQETIGTRTPFLTYNNQAPSVRYQQVYSSSDFTYWGEGAWQITQLSFSANFNGETYTLPNVQINLSTTTKAIDGLSMAFAENIGSDNQVVYSGPLQLSAPTTAQFNFHIRLQDSFLYDPTAGNLLLEVMNFETHAPISFPEPAFGGTRTLGDSTSLAVAFDVSSPTALLGSGGLWTRFTVTEVPEPNCNTMLLTAVVVIGCARSLGWGGAQTPALARRINDENPTPCYTVPASRSHCHRVSFATPY